VTFDEYSKLARPEQKVSRELQLILFAMGLNGETAAFAEGISALDPKLREHVRETMLSAAKLQDHVKKHVFHHHGVTRDKVVAEAGKVLFNLNEICELLGITLAEVAAENLKRKPK
jgi:phosphoribosyl-ATP pyrophosphohydrolase